MFYIMGWLIGAFATFRIWLWKYPPMFTGGSYHLITTEKWRVRFWGCGMHNYNVFRLSEQPEILLSVVGILCFVVWPVIVGLVAIKTLVTAPFYLFGGIVGTCFRMLLPVDTRKAMLLQQNAERIR